METPQNVNFSQDNQSLCGKDAAKQGPLSSCGNVVEKRIILGNNNHAAQILG